jgi:hypothetical protein
MRAMLLIQGLKNPTFLPSTQSEFFKTHCCCLVKMPRSLGSVAPFPVPEKGRGGPAQKSHTASVAQGETLSLVPHRTQQSLTFQGEHDRQPFTKGRIAHSEIKGHFLACKALENTPSLESSPSMRSITALGRDSKKAQEDAPLDWQRERRGERQFRIEKPWL